MILELFKYLTSTANKEARKNGSLYESVAFESRAKRLKKYWQSHWNESQNTVREFIALPELKNAKTLLVLASGSLFELPVEELKQKFEKIILVDFVFPKKVRQIAKASKGKIILVEANLNQTEKIAELIRTADAVLSCNVLSQLHLFDKQTDAAGFQQKHLDILKNGAKPTLLWSDVERIFMPKGKKEIVQIEETAQTKRPNPWKKWIWSIAPAPELHKDYDISLRVEAYLFNF